MKVLALILSPLQAESSAEDLWCRI